jgi:hypothetical protein
MDVNLSTELRNYFKDLKRKTAAVSSQGQIKCMTGKLPLDFELFCYISKRMMESRKQEFVLAHFSYYFCGT